MKHLKRIKLVLYVLFTCLIVSGAVKLCYVDVSNTIHRCYWYVNGALLKTNIVSESLAHNSDKFQYCGIGPQIIGHAYGCPNNLPAESKTYYLDLFNRGYKFIEVDIVNTADGVGIATHDSKSWIVYDSDGHRHAVNIKEMPFSELKKFFWTSGEDNYAPFEPIMTIKNLLELVKEHDVLLQIDCQSTTKDTLYDLMKYAARIGIERNIVLENEFLNEIPVCGTIIGPILTVDDIDNILINYKKNGNVVIGHVPQNVRIVQLYEIVEEAHKHGVYIKVAGAVNNIKMAKAYFDVGCDFVISSKVTNEDILR